MKAHLKLLLYFDQALNLVPAEPDVARLQVIFASLVRGGQYNCDKISLDKSRDRI